MKLSLPPRYTNTPAAAVFDIDLPDPLFRTLTQLHGLAWETNGQVTQVFTLAALAKLRGLKARQIRSHLTELESRKLIRIERLGGGRMRVYLKGNQPDPIATVDIPPALASAHALDPDAAIEPTITRRQPEPTWPSVAEPEASPIPAPTAEAITIVPARHVTGPAERLTSQNADEEITPIAPTPQLNPEPSTAAPVAEPIEITELVGDIAQIFIDDGDLPGSAMRKARRLITSYGSTQCETQLACFPARVARAEASSNGLRNASGLFIKSVTQNWDPPIERQSVPKVKTWYTAEEYEYLIVH